VSPKAAAKKDVFIVWWMSYDLDGNCYEGMDRSDCSLIGVYSDRDKAEAAVERAKLLPGFREHPETFVVDPYTLNEDHWTEGFSFE
jgi:hypothetical protein